jgi:hypothetical protein
VIPRLHLYAQDAGGKANIFRRQVEKLRWNYFSTTGDTTGHIPVPEACHSEQAASIIESGGEEDQGRQAQ